MQTWPGKGWNVILRLYGPLQPCFDKTWKPGEIEEMSAAAPAQNAAKPKMATDIPPAITMPDKVETRLGTLTFKDGFPDDATVAEGLRQPRFPARRAGVPHRHAGGVAARRCDEGTQRRRREQQTRSSLFESLMDSKSLFLTREHRDRSTSPAGWT